MKAPIILAAFGAMSGSAREFYRRFEIDVKNRFSGREILWAYTATSLVAKLKQRGVDAKTMGEAYTLLRKNGFRSAIVQSLHLVPGQKHRALLSEDCQGLEISFGSTFLETTTEISEVASELLTRFSYDRPTIVVAHGNTNNDCYNNELETFGAALCSANQNIYFTCLEGSRDMDGLRRFKIVAQIAGKVRVHPLFLTNGSHVTIDILGDQAWSIKSYLAIENFVCSEVLGEQLWVRQRFLDKIHTAIRRLEGQ